MKKLIALIALALALPAANAFAADAAAPAVSGFNPTNKVTTRWDKNGNISWAAIAYHSAGDKQYWTSSAFGGIAWKAKDTTPAASGAPGSATDSTVVTGYTTM